VSKQHDKGRVSSRTAFLVSAVCGEPTRQFGRLPAKSSRFRLPQPRLSEFIEAIPKRIPAEGAIRVIAGFLQMLALKYAIDVR
jgi:hypothetical protein